MKDKLQAVTHKECVVEKAHAKINLCLDAVSKRADGYHELRSVVVPLALHDRIVIEKPIQCPMNVMNLHCPFMTAIR